MGELRSLLARKAEEAGLSYRFVRISLEPELWVYMSRSGMDHLVVPGLYCSCPAFQRRLREGRYGCHHVYGLEIALRSGRYHDLAGSLKPAVVAAVVTEVLRRGGSSTLRRMVLGSAGGGSS